MRSALSYLTTQSSYEEYRRRLDARKVLDYYGVENDYEETTSSGETEVIHSCLLDRVDRHHNNGDAHPSASANLDRKLYICYSYWGGDFFHLIQKMENKSSFAEIVPILAPLLSESVSEPDEYRAKLQARLEAFLATPQAYNADLPSYSERVLSPWAFIHPYLYERGIDPDTVSRLQIGWREEDNRIIIPHFWDGKLVGWQARAVPDRPGEWPGTRNQIPKYRSSPGFPKSDTFYYDHSRPRPRAGSVLVVESPFSVIKATALGLDIPVLATFGAKVSDAQLYLLADYDQVIVWSDPDTAGRLMQRRLVTSLMTKTRVRVVRPDEGKDLGDYPSLVEVEAKVEGAVPAISVINE